LTGKNKNLRQLINGKTKPQQNKRKNQKKSEKNHHCKPEHTTATEKQSQKPDNTPIKTERILNKPQNKQAKKNHTNKKEKTTQKEKKSKNTTQSHIKKNSVHSLKTDQHQPK